MGACLMSCHCPWCMPDVMTLSMGACPMSCHCPWCMPLIMTLSMGACPMSCHSWEHAQCHATIHGCMPDVIPLLGACPMPCHCPWVRVGCHTTPGSMPDAMPLSMGACRMSYRTVWRNCGGIQQQPHLARITQGACNLLPTQHKLTLWHDIRHVQRLALLCL